MSNDIKALCPELAYSNVQNIKLEKTDFENSQNIFNLYDVNKNNSLDENEINNYFCNIDISDGSKDNSLSKESISKYISNSQFNEDSAIELANFTSKIFELTQAQDAQIEVYANLGKQENLETHLNPNGKIDNFSQSNKIGDCWLLSQAKALSSTSWGEDLIYDSISQNKNGDYLISFDGINEEIRVSQKELENAILSGDLYSRGDADMVLLEMAMERYFKENLENNSHVQQKEQFAQDFAQIGNPYNILSNNILTGETSLQYVLSGNKGRYTKDSIKEIFIEKANNKEANAIMCGLNVTQNIEEYASKGIVNGHAYSASASYDEQGNLNVTLINPHNTATKIILGYDEFANLANRISVIENQAA